MKLYVCWTTAGGDRHACSKAYNAVKEAGWEPEVVKSYGSGSLPDAVFNRTAGRREAKRLTGSSYVPVLVTDDGEVVAQSDEIVSWAKRNPASGAERAAAGGES
jgi:hypothetical protein